MANEFYDPSGRFSQSHWAEQLLVVLKSHGGALHTKADLYAALRELISSLGDRWDAGQQQHIVSTACCHRGLRGCGPECCSFLLHRSSKAFVVYVCCCRYTAFLDPSAFRRALRRPLPAERKYLAAQFVGEHLDISTQTDCGDMPSLVWRPAAV